MAWSRLIFEKINKAVVLDQLEVDGGLEREIRGKSKSGATLLPKPYLFLTDFFLL
jgi:hypothetical protein